MKCQGPKGELWRLHCAYHLLTGYLAWVQVTTRQVGESLGLVPVQPGDILVGDGIYSRAPQLLAVDQKEGFSLTRFSPHHLPVFAAQAPSCSSAYQFDVSGWLRTLSPGVYERQGLVHFEQTRLPVRVIAIMATPEKAATLRRKKEHEARAKGRKLSEQARFLAGFILLVTPLPRPQWPTTLVIELYASRWHIEVLFKRIKEVLDLHTLRCETPETAQAMIAALLVAWLLIEEDLEECDASSLMASLSPWRSGVGDWPAWHLRACNRSSRAGTVTTNSEMRSPSFADSFGSAASVPCSNTNGASAFIRSWPLTPIWLLFSLVQVLKLTPKGGSTYQLRREQIIALPQLFPRMVWTVRAPTDAAYMAG